MQTKVDIINALYDEAAHLNNDSLDELVYQAKVLRARQGGLPVPVRDLPFTPQNGKWFGRGCQHQCCKWEGLVQPDEESFPELIFCNHPENEDDCEGNCTAMKCPRWPIDYASMTIIEAIVETLDFDRLIAVARVLKVPCNFGFWQDDEWHDKENDLRVAVAEAMERIIK